MEAKMPVYLAGCQRELDRLRQLAEQLTALSNLL
jgi:hypothetical protein